MATDKTSVKTAFIISVCLICSLLGAACSLQGENQPISMTGTITPDIGDGGFLSGKSFGPPCFFGIVPGETTKQDAIELLQANDLDQGCIEFDNSKGCGVRGITCDIAVIIFQNRSDTAAAIGFEPSRPITVKEVIAQYGQPDVVLVAAIGSTEKLS